MVEIFCKATQVSRGLLLLFRQLCKVRSLIVTKRCWNSYVLEAFLCLQLLRTLWRGVGCVNSLLSIHLPVLPEKSNVEQRRCLFKKLDLISLRIFSVSSQVCFKLMEVISESQRDFV